MQLINTTRMTAGYNVGLEPGGREVLVVVIKGTFVLPEAGQPLRMHEQQMPLITADTFSGAPGLSAPLFEVDFALRKQRCDVLLVGSAQAPGGQPVTRMQVGLRVGSMHKRCDVVGPRTWEAGVTGIRPSAPQAFTSLPVSYDVAFGGVDQSSDDPAEHDAYLLNPAGKGFHKDLSNALVDGTPLPSTEEPGQPVTWPAESYRPMAFGPVGRGWQPRAALAGTYDQHWLDEVFPFLPADFDERYYQAAPVDQQIPLPDGPLEVVLEGFTADGVRAFVLPRFDAVVQIQPRRGERLAHRAVLDTMVFDPDNQRFMLTWRVSHPLQRSIFEIAQIRVGLQGHERWQASTDTQVAAA